MRMMGGYSPRSPARMKAAIMSLPVSRYLRLLTAIFVLATTGATTADSNDGESPIAERQSGSELKEGWRFVRTHNPHGGVDAISIMHTADISRSDLDLAGLMIRCNKDGAEVVIVVLRPFRLRARPRVVFGKPENETQFEAIVAPPGTAVVVSGDATTLVSVSWQALSDLFIRVDNGQSKIRGVVALAGLQAAFKVLVASCPVQ